MSEQLWTVNAIQAAVRATGSHWFDPATMRSFGTRVLAEVYQGEGGVFFVTSDHDYQGVRKYSVRQFFPDKAEIKTVGDVASMTRQQAVALARNKAAAGSVSRDAKVAAEPHRPVTVLQQFVDDLKLHGGAASATTDDARQLIAMAGKHHRLMEDHCNGAELYDDEGEPKAKLRKLRERIRLAAQHVGATGVVFQGDPRGCTVKLVFADGFTNDFASEGYCVPTDEH